jgi:hypothetical protein
MVRTQQVTSGSCSALLKDAPVSPEYLLSASWWEEAEVADLAQVKHIQNTLKAAHTCGGWAGCDRGLGGAGNGGAEGDCIACDCGAPPRAQPMGG